MVNIQLDQCEQVLRERISDFFTSHPERRRALSNLFHDFQSRQWTAYIFGGVARDLMRFGSYVKVRDVDIVVDDISSDDMHQSLSHYNIKRRTRFGGLHLEHGGWLFDVWALGDTWAFREQIFQVPDFVHLPKTTFLNVEAVAVEMHTDRRRKRRIHSYGFFEGLLERTVEINFEENPFPALCVVRSLITAEKLNFAIGPKLAQYIVHYGTTIPVEEMISVQYKHYGRVYANEDKLAKCINATRTQQRAFPNGKVFLPRIYTQQLSLWDDLSISSANVKCTSAPISCDVHCND